MSRIALNRKDYTHMAKQGILAPLQRLPLEEKAIACALAILTERISSLPKSDRDDLFELFQVLKKPNSREEVADVLQTMEEILTQNPVSLSEPLAVASQDPEGLAKWKEFVGRKIRELRSSAKLTQAELAEKAGIPQSHLSRLETAKYSATHYTLAKIANALKVPVSELDPSAD